MFNIEDFENIFTQITYVANRECTPNWQFKGSPIYDKHNIIFVYDGEAVLTCNNNEFKVTKGSLVYYRPGDSRKGYTFPDNLMKCYTIDFLYTLPYFNGDSWELRNAELPFSSINKIEDKFLFSHLLDLFSKFTRTWLFEKHNRVIKGRAIFSEILSLLLQKNFENDFNYDNIRKVEKVISYMTDHFTDKLTLNDLSLAINISPSYLENIFKNVTGKSPISYLIDIRIRKSKDLLKDGHTVSEVSSLVGFNDIFYFSKCFKKYVGVSPSQYKSINISSME
ncbi:helix-turn-helix domain-containing protein [Clostridium beijerinckii]|uniref:helix-turn-helix domain-containing protein n=1 Tax=Clostridium beijerinckii TaxID=1520 RepID=UPI00047B39B0|nr:AraC family transcriptional regulator [Clostridium beijerinckii]